MTRSMRHVSPVNHQTEFIINLNSRSRNVRFNSRAVGEAGGTARRRHETSLTLTIARRPVGTLTTALCASSRCPLELTKTWEQHRWNLVLRRRTLQEGFNKQFAHSLPRRWYLPYPICQYTHRLLQLLLRNTLQHGSKSAASFRIIKPYVTSNIFVFSRSNASNSHVSPRTS